MASSTGGCMCGAIRYEASADPIATAYCHCRDCQRASGGGFSTVVLYPQPAVTITKGQPKAYTVTADSGNKVTRQFCSDCGAPLFSQLEANPGLFVVKAASLDDPSGLTPAMSIWMDSAQPWAYVDPNLPRFPKQPPMG